ncbi:MAG TPA: [FeFe] hydrogenase, group A [bacterium]|jgi:iron-only hydrogenase group A|nr:[FeFe] hydrogenase, group A [bacterium]HOG38058.1 [FeFe] hydrogenase, group A [bacterium]HQI03583.1 [FeFe] hydrogenase, group A [bacterium]
MLVTIDGKKIKVNKKCTILELATKNGIKIPTLCYHPDLRSDGKCGVCVVEVNGKLMTSCNNDISDGMIIQTTNERIIKQRKINAQLVGCNFEDEEEFRKWLKLSNMPDIDELKFKPHASQELDDSSHDIVMDFKNCVLCGRCIQKCRDIQTVNAICYKGRANATVVTKSLGKKLIDTNCVGCGQCSLVCPTNAIREKESYKEIKKLLKDPKKHIIAQTAPSIRVALGEEFGLEAGISVTGQMVSALKKVGFKKVFDTNFGADLTIMEEASELIERIRKNKDLPLITSCCPAWINFIETFYPEYLNHLSSCKSPHQMFGALIKTYYAQKTKINPRDIIVVSIMPCTAKKYESCREEMSVGGIRDVDFVITTRECAKLIKSFNIDLKLEKKMQFDNPMGPGSGGGAIFASSGGVMESAIRTAHYFLTGKEYSAIDFKVLRGNSGFREASIKIGNKTLNLAIIHSLKNARKILEILKKTRHKYHFIEIMACPGGCIGGGGQPKPTSKEIIKKRAKASYEEDKSLEFRQAHKNPNIIKVYMEFLGKPLGKLSKKLLHTKYSDKSKCGL